MFERLKRQVARRLVFDASVGLEDTVILAGMARSGSTFLANLVNCNGDYRILFEPFRHDVEPMAKAFVFPSCIEPGCEDARYLEPAEHILRGRIHSDWVDRENASIFPKKRLIKDIRINFFLKWLKQHFPAVKIILLFRHPCAVVESWMRKGFGGGLKSREALLGNKAFMSLVANKLRRDQVEVQSFRLSLEAVGVPDPDAPLPSSRGARPRKRPRNHPSPAPRSGHSTLSQSFATNIARRLRHLQQLPEIHQFQWLS